jgi:hypothetical protein
MVQVPEHLDISVANEIAGSQTGSQRPQAPSHSRPRQAILAAAERHVRPYRARSGHVSGLPPKQWALAGGATSLSRPRRLCRAATSPFLCASPRVYLVVVLCRSRNRGVERLRVMSAMQKQQTRRTILLRSSRPTGDAGLAEPIACVTGGRLCLSGVSQGPTQLAARADLELGIDVT